MKTNAGYTLIEMLVTLGILSIISGIAHISYKGYNVSISKKDFKLQGHQFAQAVSNCIRAYPNWQHTDNKRLENGIPKTVSSHPCWPLKNTDPKSQKKEKLEAILDFKCPQDADCDVWARPTSNAIKDSRYICLSIEKEVSGKKLQIITRVQYDSHQGERSILCGEMSEYVSLATHGETICKNGDSILIGDCDEWK